MYAAEACAKLLVPQILVEVAFIRITALKTEVGWVPCEQ